MLFSAAILILHILSIFTKFSLYGAQVELRASDALVFRGAVKRLRALEQHVTRNCDDTVLYPPSECQLYPIIDPRVRVSFDIQTLAGVYG